MKNVVDKRKSMRLAFQNVNGFTSNTEHDILETIESRSIDLFSLAETKLNTASKKKISLKGFEVFECRRDPDDKNGGGLACIARKSSAVGFSKLSMNISDPNLQYVSKERMWVSYQASEGKTAVATVYLGFNHNDERHLEWNEGILEVLSEEVKELRGKGYRVVLNGDFNSWVGDNLHLGGIPGNHTKLPNANGKLFLSFLQRNNLVHLNGACRREGDWASRICSGMWTRHSSDHRSSTVLDYSVISTEHLSTVKNMEIDEGGACGGDSDHNCLFLTLTDKFSSFTKQRHSPKPGWNFTDDTDMSNFRNVVNREIMSLKASNIGPGVENLSQGLTSVLLKGLTEAVGKRKPPPERKQLFPRHIVAMMKERKSLEKNFKTLKCKFASSHLQTPPESLIVARDSLDLKTSELEKAKSRFLRQRRAPLLRLAKNKSRNGRKRFWDFVSGKNSKEGDITSLQEKNSGILKFTPEDISDEVRLYLKTIFSGHDDDPKLDFGSASPEEVTSENRDHDYGRKTDARLPSGGTTQDSAHDPSGFLSRPITVSEVRAIVNNLKPGKAAGHDSIVNEALKESGDNFLEMLTTLYNRVLNQSTVPKAWLRGRVTLVHKKGSKTDVNNFRPITVLTSMNAVYSKLMNSRLTEVVERHRILGEVQNGFRKGRSCSDSAFILNTVLWKSLAKRKKIHISFIDIQKAYDSVDRSILWSKMRKLGFGGKFLDSITSMYMGDFVTCQTNGITTEPVFLGRGLRQGCSLSPMLFALYIVDMSRDLVASNLGVLLKKICISAIFFADDIALVSRTPEGLRTLHEIVQRHCLSLNMKLSVTKSKVMSSSHDVWELFEQGEVMGCLEKVLQFRYLGVEASLLPSQASRSMRKRAILISKRYRGACLNIARDGPDIVDLASSLWLNIAIPSLLYGCESVQFTSEAIQEISRHQASVGKFSLGLPVCAPNVSAEAILGLKPFKQLLYSAQLKFYVRLSLQDDDRWSRDALLDNVTGGWESPYVKLLGHIRDDLKLQRWPMSMKHVDVILEKHFVTKANEEIQRLCLPALEPVAKRARMDHVDESAESQVI